MSKKKKHKIKKDKERSAIKPNEALTSNESDRIDVLDRPVGDDTPFDSPAPDAPQESNNKKPLDNIKFVAYVLSMMVTLFVAITNFEPYFESKRGKFVAKVHGDEVVSPYTRTSLVYFDEDSIDFANFDFFPIITNPTKYPLKDVFVKYTISPNLPDVSISDYYDAHKIRQNLEVTNKDNKEVTLHQSIPLPSPFGSFVMKDNEKVTITLQATYKGIKEPFFYETNIYTKRIVKENGLNRLETIFDNIKLFFDSNSIDTCDLYILDSGRITLHENFIGNVAFREISSDTDTTKISENAEMDEEAPWYMVLLFIVSVIISFFILTNSYYNVYEYFDEQFTFKSIGLHLIRKSTRTIVLQIARIVIAPLIAGVITFLGNYISFGHLSSMAIVMYYCYSSSTLLSCLIVDELFKNKNERFPSTLITIIISGILVVVEILTIDIVFSYY